MRTCGDCGAEEFENEDVGELCNCVECNQLVCMECVVGGRCMSCDCDAMLDDEEDCEALE